jgi:hypothetical protein
MSKKKKKKKEAQADAATPEAENVAGEDEAGHDAGHAEAHGHDDAHAPTEAEGDKPKNGVIVAFGVATIVSLLIMIVAVREIFVAIFDREIHDKVLAVQSSELRALRAAEQQKLTHYQWVSQKDGVVRIPVDRAVELTLATYRSPPPPPTMKEEPKPEEAPKPVEGTKPEEAKDGKKDGAHDAPKKDEKKDEKHEEKHHP